MHQEPGLTGEQVSDRAPVKRASATVDREFGFQTSMIDES